MPLLVLLVVFVLVILTLIALMPLSLVQRYRVGTARRRARGLIASLNLTGLAMSAALFLATAALTNLWVPDALLYTAGGLAVGGVLGWLGLRLTRWEFGLDALHYTPNRPLVLGLTLVVTARLLYGVWRAMHTWRAGKEGLSWLATAGVAGSMGAGALVLGYYLVYWIGLRRRLRRHGARPLRRI